MSFEELGRAMVELLFYVGPLYLAAIGIYVFAALWGKIIFVCFDHPYKGKAFEIMWLESVMLMILQIIDIQRHLTGDWREADFVAIFAIIMLARGVIYQWFKLREIRPTTFLIGKRSSSL